jgi:hypothetical protein
MRNRPENITIAVPMGVLAAVLALLLVALKDWIVRGV